MDFEQNPVWSNRAVNVVSSLLADLFCKGPIEVKDSLPTGICFNLKKFSCITFVGFVSDGTVALHIFFGTSSVYRFIVTQPTLPSLCSKNPLFFLFVALACLRLQELSHQLLRGDR
jgi:hypothetical protein